MAQATVNLAYDSNYLTALEIVHDPASTGNRTGAINDPSGLVSGIGGQTELNDVGDDGYVLLARIRFASTGDDPVLVDEAGRSIGPFDMQLGLADGKTRLVGASGATVPELGDAPETQLWAVVYDIDDNHRIDFGDLALFAPAFGRDAGPPSSQPPFVWWADFDRSGRVDFGDLAFFAPNFGKSRTAVQSGDQTLVFPGNFPDAWRPTGDGGEGEWEAMGDDAMHQPSAAGAGTLVGFDSLQESRGPSLRAAFAPEEARLEELSQRSESPVTLYSRSGSSEAEPAERVHRWSDRWEPLEDLLSLLADEPHDRLLDPHEALFAQVATAGLRQSWA